MLSFLQKVLFRVRITGESCWPNLVPNKRYWASCLPRVQKGDFILFANPKEPSEIFVKQVQKITPTGYAVASTVSWGSSSLDFGIISPKTVLGKIL
jgi:hypothetical protein